MHGFSHESRLFDLNVYICLLYSVIDLTVLAPSTVNGTLNGIMKETDRK